MKLNQTSSCENFRPHAVFCWTSFESISKLISKSREKKRSLWTNAKHLWAQPDQSIAIISCYTKSVALNIIRWYWKKYRLKVESYPKNDKLQSSTKKKQLTFSICREQNLNWFYKTSVFPAILVPQTWCHGSCQLGGWTFLENVSCICWWKWEACHPLKAPLKFEASKKACPTFWFTLRSHMFRSSSFNIFSTGGDSTYRSENDMPYVHMYTIYSIMNYDF